MRISIWQQFASNHSASYTVVGEFESTDEAKAASEKIRSIVAELFAWCDEHPDECESSDAVTPLEQHYAQLFGFDWKERIDWVIYRYEPAIVVQADRLVIVERLHDTTWQTGHQFVNLMRAMHGKVSHYGMQGREPPFDDVWKDLGIHISADASLDDRSLLVQELKAFGEKIQTTRFRAYSIPWLAYHPSLRSYTSTEINTLQAQYLTELSEFRHTPYSEWEKVRILPKEQWELINQCRKDIDIFGLTANQTLEGIEVRNINFASIPIGFPAFLEYLRSKGCTNIQYSIQQDN